MNKLYFGDNLHVLRKEIKDESVDLIYLDPPFNSNRDYNLLFKTPKGHESEAQITAFEDTWHWGLEAEKEYEDLLHHASTDVTEMLRALRTFLGENDVMAYLVMMANRLIELRRVLKPSGSLYLHCDPTVSHYLKIVMDGIFGKEFFQTEIIWKRKSGRGETNYKSNGWGQQNDIILHYSKTQEPVFNGLYSLENAKDYIEERFVYTDENGRKYMRSPLNSPSLRENLKYEYKGYKPPEKGWAVGLPLMQKMDSENRLYFPSNKNQKIYRKIFLDEYKGQPIQNVWTDIPFINPMAKERLGYPTQKPLALLERIILASSNEGDVVLDPFCGCGTAVHAAQKLNRQWLGIDITVLAISLIEKRIKQAFPTIVYEVEGLPTDMDGARSLAERDKYQFQWWACTLVGAQPFQGKKKGADGGIDGLIYFQDDSTGAKKIVVSVKGGENVSVAMIRDFAHVIEREKAAMGFFVTLAEPTRPMTTEAVSVGFYDSLGGKQYPKVQILTIEGLLNGTQRTDFPDLSGGELTFKKAQKEKKNEQQQTLL